MCYPDFDVQLFSAPLPGLTVRAEEQINVVALDTATTIFNTSESVALDMHYGSERVPRCVRGNRSRSRHHARRSHSDHLAYTLVGTA